MTREATIERKTSETQISLSLNIDGPGKSLIQTGVPFLDHMLDLFSKHGLFILTVAANGDTHIDDHHTVEDIAICLGEAFKKALGNGKGITRYASVSVPMDEALCNIAMDISNRPCLSFNVDFPKTKVGTFDAELVEEFFNAFVNNARMSLHIDMVRGQNLHHIIESIFKAFGVCLDKATQIDPRKDDIPSTKGVL